MTESRATEAISGLEQISCPVCGEDNCRRFMRFVPTDIVRCGNCAAVYVNPRRSEETIRNFFEQEYITSAAQMDYQFRALRAGTLKREADLIKRLVPSGSILDIGCAGGEFLSLFDKSEWARFAVEPSRTGGAEASGRGITVYPDRLLDARIEAGPFDVVTYLDAIPFSASPLEDLIKIRSVLKPDGLLVVEIPGYMYRLMRNIGPVSLLIHGRWCQLSSSSPHLYHFSDRVFRRLLTTAGFKVVRASPERFPETGGRIFSVLSFCYWALSAAIARLTLGTVSPAAKVVYVCKPLGEAKG